MPIDEMIDKYTLCLIKKENTFDNMDRQIMLYESEIEKHKGTDMDEYIRKMYIINSKIEKLQSYIEKSKTEINQLIKEKELTKIEIIKKYGNI